MAERPKKYRTVKEQIEARNQEKAEQKERAEERRKQTKKYAKKQEVLANKQRISKRRHAKKKRKKVRAQRREAIRTETAEEKRIREAQEAEVRAKVSARNVEARRKNVIDQELARRELCRRRLIASTVRFNPDYLAGWVHKDICMRLEKFVEDLIAGKSPRLMLQMPPRHGKSQIASIDLPAWFLGNYPNKEVILCSYSASLALDFSRAVRERLRDKEYQVLFQKTRLDKDNQNAEGWKTTKKGGFLPAGVGGPITGKGAHLLIIDDPIKNAEEAESETTRESIKKWYTSTAYTRLAPGGGVLIIQTRWHDDDLSGWLERQMQMDQGDDFEVVRYPAVALKDETYRNKGEALHPQRYPAPDLQRIQRAVGPRTWAALYQQEPVLDDGAYFQRSMFQFYDPDKLPEELMYSSAWDLAIGQKEQNDWTVGMTWGRGYDDQFYVTDMRRGRWDSYEIVAEMCDQYEKFKPSIIGIEKGVISTSLGPYLEEEMSKRKLYGMYTEELTVGRRDKVARARTIQGLMRRGRVYFPDPVKAPWVNTVMNELLRFPHGVHDDIVDAMAWLGLMLAETPAPGPAFSNLPERKGWRDRIGPMLRGTRNKSPMGA